jgi:hypothetical protein
MPQQPVNLIWTLLRGDREPDRHELEFTFKRTIVSLLWTCTCNETHSASYDDYPTIDSPVGILSRRNSRGTPLVFFQDETQEVEWPHQNLQWRESPPWRESRIWFFWIRFFWPAMITSGRIG